VSSRCAGLRNFKKRSHVADIAHRHDMQDQLNNVAKFLEARGLPEQALSVATDPDYRFELAVRTCSSCLFCNGVCPRCLYCSCMMLAASHVAVCITHLSRPTAGGVPPKPYIWPAGC
jgi:Coatomer WD associated region